MNDESAAAAEGETHGLSARSSEQRRRMTLDDFVGSRDNNFNLVRFLAAGAVLVSHSYALSTGDPAIEPLRRWLGLSLGDIAVDVFF